MRPNPLRAKFARRELVVNGWLSMPGTYSAEGAGHQGYDSVTVDLQHGMIGFDAARDMLVALSSTPAVPLARVARLEPALVMQLLDAGAYGVICPMISSPEEAATLVAACRYPPRGRRSFGPARGLLYGGRDYVRHADETVLAIAMIETAEAVEAIDAILATPGLDALYVGPNDLAMSLGAAPGTQAPAPRTEAAIARVRAAAARRGTPAGIFCPTTEIAARRAREGFALVTPGNDFALMTAAMAGSVASLRGGPDA